MLHRSLSMAALRLAMAPAYAALAVFNPSLALRARFIAR
jgi:hypothetical protein